MAKRKSKKKRTNEVPKEEQNASRKAKIATEAFGVLNLLLILDLGYRQFLLKQPLGAYLDIFILWMLASLYVVIRSLLLGSVVSKQARSFVFKTAPLIVLVILAITYFRGELTSIYEGLEILLGGVAGIVVVAAVGFLFFDKKEESS